MTANLPLDSIACGDALEVLKTFPPDSIDCLVTDPPYGLSFMGKDWDKAVPLTEVWNECLRILKSGSFAFILSSPRLDCLSQMAVRLGEAGFNVSFTPVFWAYASGFPKSEDISLQIDKRACRKKLREKLGREPTKEEFQEAWKKFRTIIGAKQHSMNFENALRNKIGYLADEANKNNKACFGYGEEKLTVPTSQEAKVLSGSFGGFQPKPAVEVIIVAMKPLSEKTYVDQALKNGKGVTWLEDARIPFQTEDAWERPASHGLVSKKFFTEGEAPVVKRVSSNEGRFPANLLVSDDALNDGTPQKGKGHFAPKGMIGSLYEGGFKPITQEERYIDDVGSFSRYFDLDAWFEAWLKDLPESVRKVFPFLIVPKAGKSERNKGLRYYPTEREGFRPNSPDLTGKFPDHDHRMAKNVHPTVKPIKLMSYLITLGSRVNEIILDPYIGSGTTAIASRLLNRHYLGIDNNPNYVEIAKHRLAHIPARLDQ